MGEATFSTRSFIKWKHEPYFNEPTSTWVLTASNNEFVDTRVVLDQKSISKNWFVAGLEDEIETKKDYLFSIAFIHKLDNFCKPGEEPGKDVGHFKNIEKTIPGFEELFKPEDYEVLNFDHHRLEEGCMGNPDANDEIEDYQEIWNTLDPINSTADSLLSLTQKSEKIHSRVYKIFDSEGEEYGRYIKIGKFGMGICLSSEKEFVVTRTFENKCIYESHTNANDLFQCEQSESEWQLTYED